MGKAAQAEADMPEPVSEIAEIMGSLLQLERQLRTAATDAYADEASISSHLGDDDKGQRLLDLYTCDVSEVALGLRRIRARFKARVQSDTKAMAAEPNQRELLAALVGTTVDWAKENLWRTSGGTAFPTELIVVTTGEVIDRPPAALTALVSLRQFKDPQAGQPCVYFLVDGDEIVYVGQSVRLWQRIAAHKADDKIFARVYYVAVPHERLAAVEAAFIKHFRPRHNTTGITRSEAAIEAERDWVESVVRQYLPGHGAT